MVACLGSSSFSKCKAWLAEKTLRSYRGHLNVHILPYFGQRRVVEINAPMIKTFLTEKRQPIPTVKIVSGLHPDFPPVVSRVRRLF
jgi:hypothetical protein